MHQFVGALFPDVLYQDATELCADASPLRSMPWLVENLTS